MNGAKKEKEEKDLSPLNHAQIERKRKRKMLLH